ncbi:acyl-CoA synthetase (AMP-forming)/AMP-acid ligase II [Arthrobacter sp. B3I9]|uniref:AMP-binding protein n=1 Tax=Arthrobacter sp. B3I9 TaxID=3042270 RepID=UPI00278CCFF2|nr:AMP-binding protein [Arthrobacter sp. B3I9]MDQ0848479.1 acyl-CoA synthetase (AMP-forming)/AMP-acid ligase II [Arthrobacter sp. B3I9]
MFSSPFPDVDIPNVSIYEYLFGGLQDDDLDRIAVVDGSSGAETTYRALLGQIDALAGGVAAQGLGVGTVAAILCPNIPVFAVAFHGLLRAGATVTTVNSLYTADEIALQLDDAGAEWLFTVSALLPCAREAALRAGIPAARLVVLDGAEGHPSLQDLLAAAAPAPAITFNPAEHVAVLPYSSGTTGRPKGVRLSHRNLVANVEQSRGLLNVAADDRLLALLPFFHIYGLTVLLNLALRQRARLVTMPRFELSEFLRMIQQHRCSYLFIAPPVAVALSKHPLVADYDLSSVHTTLSGAAPLDGELGASLARRLGCRVLQGYGMTEMSPVSHLIPVDATDVPVSSVGFTVPNMECRLVDPATGEEIELPAAGTSEPGHLLCRGPNVMLGYLNRPDETAATLDSDGFLRTGDIATVRADGVVTIVDRLKELIKYKGYQIAPAELEALLLTHPGIADAAVIGTLDADGQEVPMAFVVRQPGEAGEGLDEGAVIDFVAARVAPFKKVRRVEFIAAVPKSSSGKILRRMLKTAEPAGSGKA